MKELEFPDFWNLEIRSGTVVKTEAFEKARKPAYKVWVDFGKEIGTLKTSAQITVHYKLSDLVGKKIMGCVNIGKRNIAGFVSEFLLLGFADKDDEILLPEINSCIENGMKLH